MKTLILAVNYRSYDFVPAFFASIENAAKQAPHEEVVVAIGDTTDTGYHDISLHSDNVRFMFFGYHENLGYLGCCQKMMCDMGIEFLSQFDYIAISNVDLQLDKDFFSALSLRSPEDSAWIAPSIYTPSRGTFENPFLRVRPGLSSFLKWKIMYWNPVLYGIFEKIVYSRRRHHSQSFHDEDIYAGHGSFMLLTKRFLSAQRSLQFPSFMYGEEIYLAELVRKHGLKVRFCPELKIVNIGSVSISLLGNKWKCKQNRESLNKIYHLFFK